MNVERQGQSECMLATIAALAGRPLAEARQVACAAAGVPVWTDVFTGPRDRQVSQYWTAVNAVCATFDASGSLRAAVSEGYATQSINATQSITYLSRRIRNLPARGSGAVCIRRSLDGAAHIAPWSDGRVHDPNRPERPTTLKEFRQAYRRFGMTVEYITQRA